MADAAGVPHPSRHSKGGARRVVREADASWPLVGDRKDSIPIAADSIGLAPSKIVATSSVRRDRS